MTSRASTQSGSSSLVRSLFPLLGGGARQRAAGSGTAAREVARRQPPFSSVPTSFRHKYKAANQYKPYKHITQITYTAMADARSTRSGQTGMSRRSSMSRRESHQGIYECRRKIEKQR